MRFPDDGLVHAPKHRVQEDQTYTAFCGVNGRGHVVRRWAEVTCKKCLEHRGEWPVGPPGENSMQPDNEVSQTQVRLGLPPDA